MARHKDDNMTSAKIRAEIARLQGKLRALRQLGVFRVVPTIEPHSQRWSNSEVLVFRVFGKNGKRKIIIDPKVQINRRISLPRWRDKKKYEQLIAKKSRTEEAEQIIQKINLLRQQLKVVEEQEEKTIAQVAALRAQARTLRLAAQEMEAKAQALQSAF